jgi:hypothetical protein
VAGERKNPLETLSLLFDLLNAEKQDGIVPNQFKKKRKKQSKGWRL